MTGKNKIFIFFGIPLLASIVFSLFIIPTILSSPMTIADDSPNVQKVQYGSLVCTSAVIDGEVQELGCSHNLVTNAGLDHIKGLLGQGTTSAAFDYIGLCNATAACTGVDAADTTLDNEFTSGGLARGQGTYGSIGTGNWSIYKTFTATTDNLETNQTGIFNQSTGGTLLAENTFSLVTLDTDDQVTVNWTIFVTSG